MKDDESAPIEGQIEFVDFKEVVEQVTGTSFETIYKNFLVEGCHEVELA